MADTAQAAIKRATLAAQREVVALDSASLNELEQLYQQAAKDIAQRIAEYSGADGNVSLQELQRVLDQVNARLGQLAAARNALLEQGMASAAGLGTAPFSAGSGAISSAAAMTINREALQFVRNFVAADGLQLSDRIWRLDRHARDVAVNAIEQAVIQGHGAAQAARELLMNGKDVPADIADKINAANAQAIGKSVGDVLTGTGSPMDNAMRLMRTEINRAHGEAYIKGALAHPDAAGLRFKLSPGHPKPDICDLHAEANLYGLGRGVYPDRASCPWPAHPNTLSFVEVVFKDEVTQADREGKETPMQALERLSPAQRIGVLGMHKHEAFKDGKLTQGMIRSPWSAVQQRISDNISRDGLFEWDEKKNNANIKKHGLDIASAGEVFSRRNYMFIDRRQDYGETRWVTVGELDGRMTVIVHVQRGKATRIISFRKANSREQKEFQNRLG